MNANPEAAFGAPPPEDMVDPNAGYKVPDQKDDPFRPIGEYTEEEDGQPGKLIPGSKNKATCVGKCVAVKEDKGPAGAMLVFTFCATEGEFAGRDFDSYVSFSPKARFKVIETYKALGLPLEGPYPRKQPIGVYVVLNLQDEAYQGRWSAKLKSVQPHPKGVGFRGTSELG